MKETAKQKTMIDNRKNVSSKEIDISKGNLNNVNTTGISPIIKSIEPFAEQLNKQLDKSYPQIIKMTNSMQKIIESMTEYIKPLIDQIVNSIPKISSYFEDLKNTIEELKKSPDSIFNWIEFSKKLSDYFWLPPYSMKSEQIISLLQTVNSEEQMDIKLEQYFTTQLIDKLFDDIINMSLKKHTEILRQIKDSYNMGNYALVNTGLFSVIDSLCAFFVYNKKKDTYRINLFTPILNEEKSNNYINILILTMLNSNINFLYGHKQNTHKLARRHLSQHGEFFSNNKIDTIMLLHTTYYLLICINSYKKYKGKLVLKTQNINKKTIKRYIIRSKSNNKKVT